MSIGIDLVVRLRGLGVVRPSWGKSAYTYFSHTSGRTHMCGVDKYFDKSVALAEEAATEIERLRNRCRELEEKQLDQPS